VVESAAREENVDELMEGQRVVIKSAKLSGTVVGPRSAALKEDMLYKVHISEQSLYCRPENLVPWPEPGTKLQRGSGEWLSELSRFTELSKQYLASSHDQSLMNKIIDSGAKLGFFIPMDEEPI